MKSATKCAIISVGVIQTRTPPTEEEGKMKDFTTQKYGWEGVLKPLSALATIVPLLFGFFSCSNASSSWEEPVYDYFDKYTNTAAIEKQEIGSQTLKDSSGTTCIPSGDDKTVTFYLRNPRTYDLDLGIDLDAPILLEQDAEDKTVVRITYPQSFLLENEGGGSIGGTITLREHETQRSFDSYSFSLRCNSAPPAINNGAVMLMDEIYYLCLNIPVSDIHKDLKKIIIDDGNTKHTVEFDVDDSCNIQLPNPCILTTTNPGSLAPLPDGATFSPGTRNNLYYNSGIIANTNTVQTFKITLLDEAGLSSSAVISTASKQVKAPALNDDVSNAVLSLSGTTTLTLNEDFNAQIKIIKPTQATNGDPISNATIHYELIKDGNIAPSTATNSGGNTILTIGNTGTYTLEIWATAAGYLTSETKTYTINVPPLKVRFYANGGTLVTTGQNPQEIPKNVPTPLTQANDVVTKTGYDFTGWASSADGAKIYDDGANVTLQSNKNLYALWQAKTYTVSFNLNYTGATETAPDSITVTYDSTYGSQLPTSSPSRYGYTFSGWYTAQTGGTKVTSSTTYQTASDSTLYAHWTAKTCTVTFNANYTGSTYSQTKTETFGSNYTLPTAPTRTGYTFAGWYTEQACTNEATTVASESNHTLYAKWQANTYTVTFNKNGGSWTKNSTSVTYDAKYNQGTTGWSTNTNKPTKTGYKFLGWYTESTGGTEVKGDDTVKITRATTIYAHWEKEYYDYNHSETYCSISVTSNDSNASANKFAYNATVTLVVTPTSGYGLPDDGLEIKTTGSTPVTITPISKIASGTTVTVTFCMPDCDINITCNCRKAYRFRIGPYACTYDGDSNYIKTKCKNKTVRVWTVLQSHGPCDSDYMEVTLDNNAEYQGYICIPSSYASDTITKVCALTVNAVSSTEHGFTFSNAPSSGTGIITLPMGIMHARSKAEKSGGNYTAFMYSFKGPDNIWTYNIFNDIPAGIGFKFKFKLETKSGDSWSTAFETSESSTNSWNIPTSYLVNGSYANGIIGTMTVAGITFASNGMGTFTYP